MLTEWARDISEPAWLLAKTFWPGPLTLILKKATGVSDLVTGGQETLGCVFRIILWPWRY